ncbi:MULTISPECIES: bestrophin family protein [Rufibacter]|uniref:Putative membrane protein n=1 Tax=Rufibacter quisquiliarum TaxID=1549639 RepID=A0A839GD32_9BACT|nr:MULTISPECIES: bestrophin family ion channel [Rufibacter]MBA9076300.1 putative membrane protein [Rufibacter quisquiliarum]
MINYNPKDWFIFIFRFSKSDTFRQLLPLLIMVGIYAGFISFLENHYLQLSQNDNLKNVGLMHSVLGFVLSLLLVFRTNTAYDRWWEGRKVWGSLTNVSRNLALKLQACVKDQETRSYFRQMIPNFAFALKNHLRENEDYQELDPVLDLKPEKHLPNQIACALFDKVNALHQQGALTTAQLLVLDEEIKTLTEITGASERIKNTPIPFTYSVFIKKFIFFYVMTLPFGWSFSMGYYVIPVVMLILYAMASLELIAEEIENPFGTDDNDLPLDQICTNIRKHVAELLD